MSRCQPVRDALPGYLVGALDDGELTEVEAHLVDCAECAAELAELVTLEDDLQALAAQPQPVTRGGWWAGLALAAGLLLGLLLSLAWPGERGAPSAQASAPRLLHGALLGAQAGQALELGQAVTARGPSVIDLQGGSLAELEAGAKLVLIGPRELRLQAGAARIRVAPGDDPFDLHAPHAHVRALGTTFAVQIAGDPRMTQSQRTSVGVAVATAVAVSAGAVLLSSDDAAVDPVRLEAGQTAVAASDGIRTQLEAEAGAAAAAETIAALESETREQQARIARLEHDKAALEARLTALEGGQPVEAPVAPPTPGQGPGRLAIEYGRWGEIEALRDADWAAMGEASVKAAELLPQIVEAVAAGEQPPRELGIEFAKANQVLAVTALAVNGQLPTHVTGNGEYTHPYVMGNLIAANLEQAGLPLDATQAARVAQLGEGYDAAWEQQQRGYSEDTWQLQKVLDEVELKHGVTQQVRQALSPDQVDSLGDARLRDRAQVDVFSPAAMLGGLVQPVVGADPAELRTKLIGIAAQALGVTTADVEPHAGVFDRWIAAATTDPAQFLELADVVRAGRAQEQVLRELALRLQVDDEVVQKLRERGLVYVPKLPE